MQSRFNQLKVRALYPDKGKELLSLMSKKAYTLHFVFKVTGLSKSHTNLWKIKLLRMPANASKGTC